MAFHAKHYDMSTNDRYYEESTHRILDYPVTCLDSTRYRTLIPVTCKTIRSPSANHATKALRVNLPGTTGVLDTRYSSM
jgi:hypothetical protein